MVSSYEKPGSSSVTERVLDKWFSTPETTPAEGDPQTTPTAAPAQSQATGDPMAALQEILNHPQAGDVTIAQPTTKAASVDPMANVSDLLRVDPDELDIWSSVQAQVPRVPNTRSSFWKAWDTVTDIVGTPIDKVGDVLSWPSNRLEQVAGLIYWNDVKDWGDRWELGQLTWEMIGPNKGELRDSALKAAFSNDPEALGQFVEQHEGGVSDFALSFFLDPMNILGMPGFGLAAKGAKALGASEEIVKGLQLLNRGVDAGVIESIGLRLPAGARPASQWIASNMRRVGIGGDFQERIIQRAQDGLTNYATESMWKTYQAENRMRSPGVLRNLLKQTPKHQANDRLVAGLIATKEFVDSAPEQVKVQAFWHALSQGDGDALAAITGNRQWTTFELRDFAGALGSEMKSRGLVPERLGSIPSFRVDPRDPEQVKELLLKSQDPTLFLDPAKASMQWQKRFYADIQGLAEDGTDHWYGIGGKVVMDDEAGLPVFVPRNQELEPLTDLEKATQSVERMHATFKRLMGIGYLNRPGFTMMNILSNHFHVAWDGFGGFGGFRIRDSALKELGLSRDTIKTAAQDAAHLAEAMGLNGTKKNPFLTLTPWTHLAAANDEGARTYVTYKGTRRVLDGMMQYEDDSRAMFKGTLPKWQPAAGMDEETYRAFTDDVLSVRTEDDLANLRRKVATGTYGEGAGAFVIRELKAMGFKSPNGELSDEGVLMLDNLIDDFIPALDDRLAAARQDGESLYEVVGDMAKSNMEDINRYRDPDMNSLYPTRILRPEELLARRVRTEQVMHREQADFSIGFTRWMGARGYNRTVIDEVGRVLSDYHKKQREELVKLFDVIDGNRTGRKVKDAADERYVTTMENARKALNAAVEKALGRQAVYDAPPMWRRLMAREAAAAEALKEHRRTTVKAVREVEDRYAPEVAATLHGVQTKLTKARERLAQLDQEAIEITDPFELQNMVRRQRRARRRITKLETERNAGDPGALWAERGKLWEAHDQFRNNLYSTTLDTHLIDLKIPRLRRPEMVPGDLQPIPSEGAQHLFDLRDEILQGILRRYDGPTVKQVPLEAEHTSQMLMYIDNVVAPALRENRTVALRAGRNVADTILHNYEHRYGIDEVVKFLFPYHFWPSRTMARWAQRTMAQPAATAMWSKLQDAQDDTDLPERLKNKFRIPIPFLPDWMGGGTYFDPTRLLFPYADQIGSEETEGLSVGGFFDWSNSLGMGFAPWVTIPTQVTAGLMGARTDQIQFQMSGMPWIIPGTRAQRAITGFITGKSEDQWQGDLTQEDIEKLTLGDAFPEPRLREILGIQPGDQWDYYRVLRMVSDMAGDGTVSPEEALRAIRERTGPVWEQAKDRAETENGIRDLSSYALGFGMTIYPKGEQIQRGLKMLYDSAREQDRTSRSNDNMATRAFFEAFPEYQVKQTAAAYYRGKPAIEQEVDTSLYYIDVAKVHDEYDAKIELYSRYPQGFKAELAQLKDERRKALDDLDRMYSKRAQQPGVFQAPHDRALWYLREQWYSIDADTPAKREAAQMQFLAKLTGQGKGATYYSLAQEADLLLNDYSQKIAETKGDRQPLYTERDQKVEALTQRAMRDISAADFMAYLESSKRDPDQETVNAQRESDALRRFFSAAVNEREKLYADFPGLGERYGVNPDAATAGMLDSLWAGYRALQPDSLERQDYVSMFADDINAYRAQLGLPPIVPTQKPYVGAPASLLMQNPIEAAILASEQNATGP